MHWHNPTSCLHVPRNSAVPKDAQCPYWPGRCDNVDIFVLKLRRTNVAPPQKDRPFPSLKWRGPISHTHVLDQKTRTDLKKRLIVLARTNINLTDWPTCLQTDWTGESRQPARTDAAERGIYIIVISVTSEGSKLGIVRFGIVRLDRIGFNSWAPNRIR
jgi:hypothetical protein